jgi:hypothetical protein
MRNRVERFFRYLKERTMVFHHKMSAKDHIQGINNLKQFLNPIHNILPHREDREVNKKCLDTIWRGVSNYSSPSKTSLYSSQYNYQNTRTSIGLKP